MKTKSLLLVCLGTGLLFAGACTTVKKPSKPPRVSVTYAEPDKFTDVRERWPGTDKERESILEVLKEFIVERAEEFLPAGQKLELTVRDVDLAGDFEPWRGMQLGEIRIVKEMYPPRIKFDFRITDLNGKELRKGQADLRDLAFMMRSAYSKQESYRFEKEMLDDWFRSELRDRKP